MTDNTIFPDLKDADPAALYLDLVKRCLINSIYPDWGTESASEARREGKDWPIKAHSMCGVQRLNSLQRCVETVLNEHIPGDLLEAGVWRGGAAILMRAVLKSRGETNRRVWLADSFEGLPPPDVERYPHDRDLNLRTYPELAVSLEQVKENFRRYGLLDEQVRFIPGWFRDTLAHAPVERLAVLRLDGDLYESTIEALDGLYPRLSDGGFLIVDDYGAVPACAQAVDDFRSRAGVDDAMITIDWTGMYWRKGFHTPVSTL